MHRFVTYVIDPIILVVFSAGFFLFMYGAVEMLINLNKGGDTKEGKQHMIWGIVGMLIMVSVEGIINLVAGTFGLDISGANVDTTTINNSTSNTFFK